jgi:hypothetical protein
MSTEDNSSVEPLPIPTVDSCGYCYFVCMFINLFSNVRQYFYLTFLLSFILTKRERNGYPWPTAISFTNLHTHKRTIKYKPPATG